MPQGGPEHCPVCRSRFRGARTCGRCGADLAPLMRILVRAWILRGKARRAILDGDLRAANKLVCEAQEHHATAAGHELLKAIQWIERSGCLRAPD